MFSIWLAVGSFLLPPVSALMLTVFVPPPRRKPQRSLFLMLWTYGASGGLLSCAVLTTITGIWLPVVAYAASLLLCDLTAVVALEILKRTLIRIQRWASERYYPLDSPGWPQNRR
jgi:hypothetical protein